MRLLRPELLFAVGSDLWVVDEFQPVAVVVDLEAGAVQAVVSWAQLPPGPGGGEPTRRARRDGSHLWVQEERGGPLARVGAGGVERVVWTSGLGLVACGPGVAWCASDPPAQELLRGEGAEPAEQRGAGALLRMTADGDEHHVRTEGPVRRVLAVRDGLLLQVEREQFRRRHLGGGLYEVVRDTDWLALPWDAPVPEHLTAAQHAVGAAPGSVERIDDGGLGPFLWRTSDEPDDDLDELVATGRVWFGRAGGRPDVAGPDLPEVREEELPVLPVPDDSFFAVGRRWRLGWPGDRQGPKRQVIASTEDPDGRQERQWDLGDGEARCVQEAAAGVVVALRGSGRGADPSADRVLLLHPDRDEVRVLLPAPLPDITAHCWPLVPRPADTDSYLRQILPQDGALDAFWSDEDDVAAPLAEGLSDSTARLVGDWPVTELEWTFTWARRAGLRLRRRVVLFDELGRIEPPVHADIALMEDLDTGEVPAAEDAVHGVLDV